MDKKQLKRIEKSDVDIETLKLEEVKRRPNTLNVSELTLAAVVQSTEQARRIDALDELSEFDQDMGRYDE